MKKSIGILRLYESLANHYRSTHYQPIPYIDARRVIQTTTGTSWPAGTTIDDILDSLEEHKLIIKGTPFGSKTPVVIPLERE